MDARTPAIREEGKQKQEETDTVPVELVILIKALLNEPPADHDLLTCPLCKKYGISNI